MHGRTKEQKGRDAPPANWDIIRKIKYLHLRPAYFFFINALFTRNELRIPVVANGSIDRFEAIKKCLDVTGV